MAEGGALLDWSANAGAEALRCPICGSSSAKTFLVSAPYLEQRAERARFLRCGDCGSLLHDGPIRAFEHIQEGEREVFLRQYLESTAGLWEMFWPVACVADAHGRSLLELGCGFGLTVDLWQRIYRAPAYGCDPADYAAAGRRVLGPRIHPRLLRDVPELVAQQFDLVYASEVIEHVEDPGAFVAEAAARLSPRGVLVLTTPAAEFVARKNDPATVTAALAPGFHAFLFSAQALEGLLRRHGFGEVVVERHNERLIAWAARVPFARVSPAERFSVYLDALGSARLDLPAGDRAAEAFAAGLAYRNYKERLLRGMSSGLAEARARALSLALVVSPAGNTGCTPTELLARVAECAEGPRAFGEQFRFCLPQMAFLEGLVEANRDLGLARQWFRLMQLATERLCAHTALAGLEAVSFYWQAEFHRLAGLIENGDAAALAQGLLRLLEAVETPLTTPAGASPAPETAFTMIERILDGIPGADYGAFLERVAQAISTQADSAEAVILSGLCAAVGSHLRTGGVDVDALQRARSAAAWLPDRSGRLRALIERRLAAEQARARPSFATLREATWGGGWRR
ncbi:MAG: class I SAM-dependent methyltransferase [Casimicrobiaceae bacterium]